jgi:hypothetical protein
MALLFAITLVAISKRPSGLLVEIMVWVIGLGTVAACVLVPTLRIRKVRKKGLILFYEKSKGIIQLPRENISVLVSDVLEFRVLQERQPLKKDRSGYAPIYVDPAELQLIRKSSPEMGIPILQTVEWETFRDAVDGLKGLAVAKVYLIEQERETREWSRREL